MVRAKRTRLQSTVEYYTFKVLRETTFDVVNPEMPRRLRAEGDAGILRVLVRHRPEGAGEPRAAVELDVELDPSFLAFVSEAASGAHVKVENRVYARIKMRTAEIPLPSLAEVDETREVAYGRRVVTALRVGTRHHNSILALPV